MESGRGNGLITAYFKPRDDVAPLTPLGEALHTMGLVDALVCDALVEQCVLRHGDCQVYLWTVDHEVMAVRVRVTDGNYRVYGPTLVEPAVAKSPDALRAVVEPSVAHFLVANEACPEALKLTVEADGKLQTLSIAPQVTREDGKLIVRPLVRPIAKYAGMPLTRGCLSEDDLLRVVRVAAREFGVQGWAMQKLAAYVKSEIGTGAEPLLLPAPFDPDTKWHVVVVVTPETIGVKPQIVKVFI